MTRIKSIAVVGAGTMGLGIAQVCATAGFKTLLFDINGKQLQSAVDTISKNLSYLAEKGKLEAQVHARALANLTTTQKIEDLRVDMVIEAAVEKLDVKQDLFERLEKINDCKSILATNTSSISVTRIAERLKEKSRCIGFHFFNPADRMKLVEIISGKDTDPAHVKELRDFATQIGKTAVVAKDSPGFIVNRVARHFYVESLKLLEDGAATIPDIDALLRSSGFRMGPFELMDLIGVDTNLAVTTSIYEGFHRISKFKPSHMQQRLVAEGKFGKKTGEGFYEYSK
jgi:3-hydroxybutyryl-CoA dehydrogenase